MIWFLTGPFLYLAAAVFAVGASWKVVSLARLPRHLRWELYPIPRLGAAGSKYEKVDFAALPRHSSRVRELFFVAQEVLLLKKVYAARRDLWLGTWLLHMGLYLGIALLGVLAIAPRLPAAAVSVVGLASLLCGMAGVAYLLGLRLYDRGLRDMSDPVTFFNLALLAALFGSGLWAWRADPGFVAARAHLVSLLRGQPAAVASPGLASALVLGALFAAYLPFSRMFHAAAKYFFYHAILWDDEPMQPGSRMEREMSGYLHDRLTWRAAHIRPNLRWHEQLDGNPDEKGASHGP